MVSSGFPNHASGLNRCRLGGHRVPASTVGSVRVQVSRLCWTGARSDAKHCPRSGPHRRGTKQAFEPCPHGEPSVENPIPASYLPDSAGPPRGVDGSATARIRCAGSIRARPTSGCSSGPGPPRVRRPNLPRRPALPTTSRQQRPCGRADDVVRPCRRGDSIARCTRRSPPTSGRGRRGAQPIRRRCSEF